jgi:hypothetical protein
VLTIPRLVGVLLLWVASGTTLGSAAPAPVAVDQNALQDRLRAIAPTLYQNRGPSSFTLIGGELGRVDPATFDGEAFLQLLLRLRPISDVTGEETFEVVERARPTSADAKTAFEFRQLIDGIRVRNMQRVIIRGGGTIISVQADVVGPERPRSAVNVDRQSARLIAISTARSREPRLSDVTETANEGYLEYDVRADGLTPFWWFGFPGAWYVRVNATTGEAFLSLSGLGP